MPNARDLCPDLVARLGPATLALLCRQGFVSIESRANGAVTYKLRWRADGRQHALFLGSDPEVAMAVQDAVTALQRPRRQKREMAQLLRQARIQLSRSKQLLKPVIEAAGLRLHGYTARRPRTPPTPPNPSPLSHGDPVR